MKSYLCLAATCLLSLAACSRSAQPSPDPQPQTPQVPPAKAALSAQQQPELSAHRSPISLKLLGPEQVSAGQDIDLTAEIEQFVGSSPVSIELQLPAGARLVSGAQTELLPPGNAKLVRHYLVHLDTVPDSDLELVAGTRTASFGARARSSYRFGRPEPRFTDPPRGKPLTVNGHDVGTPIELHRHEP
jgi:hypothetical protein